MGNVVTYSSISHVAEINQMDERSFSWRRLKAISEKLGKEVKKVPCETFGTKNIYSHEAWAEAYPDVKLPTISLPIKKDGKYSLNV